MASEFIGDRRYMDKFISFAERRIPIVICGLMLPVFVSAESLHIDGELEEQSLSNMKSTHENYLGELKYWSGNRSTALIDALHGRYPDYRVASTCQGTFHRIGNRDFGVGILNPTTHTGAYLAILRNGDHYDIAELSTFPISFDTKGNLVGGGMDIICPSWTEIARIKEDYSRRPSNDAAHSDLRAKTKFDAVCATTLDGDAEYLCYEFDFAKRKFVAIGGWYNG